MKPFESWYAEIISDERWYERTLMTAAKGKSFKTACEKVYLENLAENTGKSIGQHRQHIANVLWKMPVDKTNWVSLQQKEEPKEDKEWTPVTGEARAEWLKKWKKEVEALPALQRTGSLTKEYMEQNGQVRPAAPKGKVYPSLSAEEVYVRERHLAWLKHRFHPVTMDILPDTMDEDLFNKTFDENYLMR